MWPAYTRLEPSRDAIDSGFVLLQPNLIPREVIVYVSEPEEAHVRGPPLFLDPKEVIYHNRPILRYRVRL
jgi:hypothetical protein